MVEKSALFVCLGNICRSPMAEAIFRKIVKENGDVQWVIDSAATAGYHVGGKPDKRTLKTLKNHGITDYNHVVRQMKISDFQKFDYILVMDDSNMEDVKEMSPAGQCKAQILKLGSFDKDASTDHIMDPYYSDDIESFEKIYQQCLKCCSGFLSWASSN